MRQKQLYFQRNECQNLMVSQTTRWLSNALHTALHHLIELDLGNLQLCSHHNYFTVTVTSNNE